MNIEERIVSLGFNNQNFEKHAQQSLTTLDKLDRTLDAFGGERGMGMLTSALEAVTSKFSILGTIGDQVLRKLTDGVMGAIGQITGLVKSMSFDQIGSGFEKYGNKTTAVATLLAQGYKLDRVNQLMEDLNWFTDETSYNFTDMVGEIAKFTAQGQGLEDSVTAMEGIALWAALSGQNAAVASRAMMQLSQAMSHGGIKTEDWRSIQNANMDTQEFRKQAIAAAIEVGTLKETADGFWETTEKTIKAGEKFNINELFSSEGLTRTLWLNSDTMMKVFNKYSKAVTALQKYMDENDFDTASQAMDALEKEAKELAETTGISVDEAFKQLGYDMDEFSLKALRAGQQARTWTDVLNSVKDAVSTGWMNTFERLIGDAEEATRVYTDLSEGLWTVFAGGGETRNKALDLWIELGDRAKLFNEETGALYRLGRSFLGLFDELHGGLLKVFGPDVEVLAGDTDYEVAQLYSLFRSITNSIIKAADAMEYFVQRLQEVEAFAKIFEGLHYIWAGLKKNVSTFGKTLKYALAPVLDFPTDHPWIESLIGGLDKIANGFLTASKRIDYFLRSSTTLAKVVRIAKGVADAIDVVVTTIKELVDQLVHNFEPAVAKFRVFNFIEIFAKIGDFISKLAKSLNENGTITKVVTFLIESFGLLGDVIDIVGIAFSTLINTISTKAPNLAGFVDKIVVRATEIVTSIRKVLNDLIESGKIESTFSSISGALESFFGILGKIGDFIFKNSPIEFLIKTIGKAAELLGKALEAISNSFTKVFGSTESFSEALFKIGLSFGGLFLTIRKAMTGSAIRNFLKNINDVIEKIRGLTGEKSFDAKQLKSIATSIALLAASLVALSLVDGARLAASLGIITAGVTGLIKSVEVLNNMPRKAFGATTDLLKIAAAVFVLSIALINVSVAMLIVAAAIRVIAGLKPLQLLTAFVALVAMIAAMAFVLGKLAKYANPGPVLAAGAALLLLGAALLFVTAALVALSFIKWQKLLKAGIALVATVALLAVIMGVLVNKVENPVMLIAAAGALLILSVAIAALTAAITVLALIPLWTLVKSMVALTLGLLAMAVVLKALSAVALPALMVGAAMVLLGFGLVELAASVLILAVALHVLAPLQKKLPALAGCLALLGAALIPLALAGLIMSLGSIGLLAFIPFIKSLKNLNGVDLKAIAGGLALLAPALLLLSIAGLALTLGAPGLLIGGLALTAFGLCLRVLGSGLESMKDIGFKQLAAIAGGLALIGLAGIPLLLGVPGLLLGTPALLSLGKALPEIAAGFAAFSEVNWGEIAKGTVSLASAIGALFFLQFATIRDGTPVLLGLAEALPGIATGFSSFEGVKWGDIIKGSASLASAINSLFFLQFTTIRDGTPVLVGLAEALPGIATGFKSFEGLNAGAIIASGAALAQSITALFTLQFATIRDGTPALLGLANALPLLASGFKDFELLNAEMILSTGTALATTIRSLFTLQFASIVDGTTALINLGRALPILAEGFRAFQGLAPEWIEMTATSLANGIKALLGNFFSNLFQGNVDFTTLALGISQLAAAVASVPEDSEARLTGIANGILAMSTIVVESLTTISLGLQQILMEIQQTMLTIQQVTTESYTQIIMQTDQFTMTILMKVQTFITTLLTRVQLGITQLTLTTIQAITTISDHIRNGVVLICLIIDDGVKYIDQSLAYCEYLAYNHGVMIGQGLANGLMSQVGNVRAAANALAAAANTGVSGPMEIESPSRVMIRMGQYIGEGLGIGIQNESDVVEKATTDVINPLLLVLQELMEGDFDLSPQITPVVDISNAESAAGQLRSMFTGGKAYAVSSAGRIAANELASGGSFGNTNNVANTTNVTINVNARQGQNVNELATAIEQRIVKLNKQQRLGALA